MGEDGEDGAGAGLGQDRRALGAGEACDSAGEAQDGNGPDRGMASHVLPP